MYKYPRTHLGLWLTATLLVVVASLPASAQNGTRSNSGQAVLHIRINVVPTVTLPPAQPSHLQSGPVTYNVPMTKPDLEVREEIRPLSGTIAGQSIEGKGAILKTLTIVVH